MSDGTLLALIKYQMKTLKQIKKTLRKRRLLPKELRQIEVEVLPGGKLVLLAGFHESADCVDWTSLPFSDFSQTLTCLDDLERLVFRDSSNAEST